MQIVGISEPGEADEGDELVVGIDFGTTNSLIAISQDYKAKIIKMEDGAQLVPSIILRVVRRTILVMGSIINPATRRLFSITKMRNPGSSKKLNS